MFLWQDLVYIGVLAIDVVLFCFLIWFLGLDDAQAVENVNSIIGPALIGKVIYGNKSHYLDLELQRVIDLMWVFLQDPTEQVQIDNFMVQQLDGTVNEWGWCKQKVCLSS